MSKIESKIKSQIQIAHSRHVLVICNLDPTDIKKIYHYVKENPNHTLDQTIKQFAHDLCEYQDKVLVTFDLSFHHGRSYYAQALIPRYVHIWCEKENPTLYFGEVNGNHSHVEATYDEASYKLNPKSIHQSLSNYAEDVTELFDELVDVHGIEFEDYTNGGKTGLLMFWYHRKKAVCGFIQKDVYKWCVEQKKRVPLNNNLRDVDFDPEEKLTFDNFRVTFVDDNYEISSYFEEFDVYLNFDNLEKEYKRDRTMKLSAGEA